MQTLEAHFILCLLSGLLTRQQAGRSPDKMINAALGRRHRSSIAEARGLFRLRLFSGLLY